MARDVFSSCQVVTIHNKLELSSLDIVSSRVWSAVVDANTRHRILTDVALANEGFPTLVQARGDAAKVRKGERENSVVAAIPHSPWRGSRRSRAPASPTKSSP